MSAPQRPELDPASRRIRAIATVVFFVVVPAVWTVTALVVWFGSDKGGFDLRHAFLPAAENVLDGDSPYPALDDPAVLGRYAYVYTPVVAYATVPLTVLPTDVAVDLAVVASFAAVLAALALVGVRDWRCYTVALAWAPVVNSAGNVAVSLPIAVLVAAAWRLRGRELASGALVGTAVAVKSFAWPLLLWPVAQRRARSALTAVGVALVLSFGTWAALGFAGLRGYPDLLRAVTDAQEDDTYSISGLLLALGAGTTLARAVLVVVTLLLVWAAFVLARRGSEERSFVALLLASLAATPILWQHYLVLLLVALAVARPRISAVWFAPLALYAAPMTGNGALWQTALVPLVVAVVGAACLAPARGAAATGVALDGAAPSRAALG